MAFNYRLQYREARSPNNCIPASIDISTAISTDSIRLCFYVCPLHSSNFVIISSSTLETIETPRNGRIVLEFFFRSFFFSSSFFALFRRQNWIFEKDWGKMVWTNMVNLFIIAWKIWFELVRLTESTSIYTRISYMNFLFYLIQNIF